MDHLEIDRVDRIRLTGALGAHIDAKYAMILGMMPANSGAAQGTSKTTTVSQRHGWG
jgi:uncharacterized 2Fe-2S/4Fe-4S cluster protein (DUF4445 family)